MRSNDLQGFIAESVNVLGQFGVLRLRLFIDGSNAGAGDDVVELIEADGFPGLLVIGNWILVLGEEGGIG